MALLDGGKQLEAVQRVLDGGTAFHINSVEDFDKCVDHIVQLFDDAFMLHMAGSYATSAFISIAAMEEVSKTEMALFAKEEKSVKRDPLRDHKTKEVLSAAHTVQMGSRLVGSIGMGAADRIYDLVYGGKLKGLREDALYWDIVSGRMVVPEDRVDCKFSLELLLFSIEVFDDRLVGFTQHSMDASKKTDELFEKASKQSN